MSWRFVVVSLAVLTPMLVAQAESAESPAGASSQEESSLMQKLKEGMAVSTPQAAPKDGTPPLRDEIMERIWCGAVEDQVTRDVCWQAYQARMNYYIGAMGHRSRVFWWQHMASRAIFLVVISLVTVGVYFAWVQFRKDIAGPPKEEQHQIELATSGLKVSSPVLGVIILVVSLAFFYLYLVYVFPIIDTF